MFYCQCFLRALELSTLFDSCATLRKVTTSSLISGLAFWLHSPGDCYLFSYCETSDKIEIFEDTTTMTGSNEADGNYVYGYDKGLNLRHIQRVWKFNNEVWFLVLWEGYDMLEAVPAEKINDKFPLKIIEYFEKITVNCHE